LQEIGLGAKRSERLRDLLQMKLAFAAGVSVENQKQGLPRIDHMVSFRQACIMLCFESARVGGFFFREVRYGKAGSTRPKGHLY
jgi:hypothetical protein